MNRLYLHTSRRLATAILTQRYTAAALLSPAVITHALPSTTTVSYPSSPADIQLLQRRYMVSKKKDKGKKGGGNNNKTTTKLFQPVWHPSDMKFVSEDDDSESFKDLNDLQKKCNDYYGWEKKDLEMMDNNDNWKKLTTDELKKFNGKIVKVRDKEIYSEEEEEDYGSDEDDDYYPGDYDDDDEYGYNPGMKKKDTGSPPPMRECISKLIAELKFNGYERVVDAKALQKASTGETILTKEYILKKASDDEELLSLLVDNIGAIDHVIQCIHDFDPVWNNVKIEEEKDGDDEKDEKDEEDPFKDL